MEVPHKLPGLLKNMYGKLLIDASKDARIKNQLKSDARKSLIVLGSLLGFICIIVLLGLFNILDFIASLSITLTLMFIFFAFLYISITSNFLRIYDNGIIYPIKFFRQDIFITYSNIKSFTKLPNGYYHIVLLNKIRGLSKSIFLAPDLIPDITEFEKIVSGYVIIGELDKTR